MQESSAQLMQESSATAHTGELSHSSCRRAQYSSCRRAQHSSCRRAQPQLMQESSATAHAGVSSQPKSSYSDPKLRYHNQFQNCSSENYSYPKIGPTNNNFYRNYSLNQPTTRVNCHDYFMALNQRLTRVGENPYL